MLTAVRMIEQKPKHHEVHKKKIMSNSTKSKSDDPVLLHQLQGLKDAVHDICWDPKNKKIAAASNDTSVYLWDMGNQNIRAYK